MKTESHWLAELFEAHGETEAVLSVIRRIQTDVRESALESVSVAIRAIAGVHLGNNPAPESKL